LATGRIAELFTQDLTTSRLHVVAVGSRSLEKARTFADRFAVPTAHGSYEELVADQNVDIVYIATPHPQHVDAAMLALDAGKHVLVEKPFALNADQARRIVQRTRVKNLVVLEAMWTRFLPHMRRIHEIIDAGRRASPTHPTYFKVRRGGRVVSVAVIIAVGVNNDGRREVLVWKSARSSSLTVPGFP
jgi:predicted dehydrogenase